MPPKVEFEQIDEHGSMVHSVISCSLGFHGKGCCDPSTIGDYTLSFNRLYFFVLYSGHAHAMSLPLFLLSRKESFHARAFCLCGEVNGRRTPTFGVPRACPFYPPGVGLSLSPDHTCGRSRRTAESPGGGRPALSPPDR